MTRPSGGLTRGVIAQIKKVCARHRATQVRAFGPAAFGSDERDTELRLLVVLSPGPSPLDREEDLEADLENLLGIPVHVVSDNPDDTSEYIADIRARAIPLAECPALRQAKVGVPHDPTIATRFAAEVSDEVDVRIAEAHEQYGTLATLTVSGTGRVVTDLLRAAGWDDDDVYLWLTGPCGDLDGSIPVELLADHGLKVVGAAHLASLGTP